MPRIRSSSILAFLGLLLAAALAACGGSSPTATTAPTASPTIAADRAQATQLVTSASPTTVATPTPLAANLPTGAPRSTEAARATSGATTDATTNGATPTPLARVTATAGTPPTGGATATSAPGGGIAARSTQASGSAVATASASGSAAAGTAGPPTTTPVPATEARGSVEQFLRAVLGKGDISGYLTPAFKSQAGGDGYKLLDIQPPVQEFTVDSEQRDADGNGATVRATITTASGVAKRGFVMRKQGSTWLIDNVIS